MNADRPAEDFDKGENNWGLIVDVKTDSRLFEEELSGNCEWAPESKALRCLLCDLEFFCKTQHTIHHLQHVSERDLYVPLTPLPSKTLRRLAAGKSVKKRPGPRSKTEGFVPPQQRSPLKLTIKRRSTCREPAFEVVSKVKSLSGTAMDDLIAEGGREVSLDPQAPSPTPSDILRQEGFLAPEPLEGSARQEVGGSVGDQDLSNKEDSGASCNGDPDPPESSLLPPPSLESAADKPVQNGTSDSEPEAHKGTESSDSGCEKDGSEKDFTGFTPAASNNSNSNSNTTPPPNSPSPSLPPIPKGITILAPSAVNNSVLNGSFPAEPLDANVVSETLSSLVGEQTSSEGPPPPPPTQEKEKVGLTIKSAEALGATSSGSVNLLNINTGTNNPLGLLQGYVEPDNYLETCDVCGDRSGNLEQHRATMGHYKCLVGPECAAVVFPTVQELSNHQHVVHGMAPRPSSQPSIQQLQQQVQRIPFGLPHPGMGTPPPAVSPGYRIPGGITLTYPGGGSPSTTPTPVQGSIQARPFAMATSPSAISSAGSPASSPALPPNLGRSISISPSTKGTQKRPAPPTPQVETTKRSRSDSPDCELVDVQQPLPALPSSISLTVRGGSESSGVANILASRGITLTPAANKASSSPGVRANSSQPLTTLNLSSAVSIVPSNQARGRSVGRPAAQVKPPTVDLTQDSTPSFRRNRPQRFPCQICDKVFQSQETLNQHLTTHRSPGKLPYKCSLCNAQYPTQQGLVQHKQTYHKEAQGSEMALPVVDMKQPSTMQKLSQLGIRHCLVMSQLVGNSAPGMFGIPIVAIDNARNPAVCNLAAIGACNVLSLGPAKALR